MTSNSGWMCTQKKARTEFWQVTGKKPAETKKPSYRITRRQRNINSKATLATWNVVKRLLF